MNADRPGKKFRKLEVNLPVHKMINQRPFLISGIILAVIILVITGYAYLTQS